MPKLSFLQRSLIALVLFLLAMYFAVPWSLYYLGLQDIKGRPELPTQMLSVPEQEQLWANAGFEGLPELVELDPVSYIVSASGQDMPAPVTMFAWRIASAYQRQHHLHDGVMWQQLSGGALTIWLTRHWTMQQLLSKVAELEAQKRHTTPEGAQAH